MIERAERELSDYWGSQAYAGCVMFIVGTM